MFNFLTQTFFQTLASADILDHECRADFVAAFPPAPLVTAAAHADCAARYRRLGFPGTAACGDGSGQFVLRIPYREFVYDGRKNCHQLLLKSQAPAAAAALRQQHNGTDTIWLGVGVWKHVRVHVNNHLGEMVVHAHTIAGAMSTVDVVLCALTVFMLTTHQLFDTHLTWLHAREVTVTVVTVVVLELGLVIIAAYALHCTPTQHVFVDSAAWVYPTTITVVWVVNAVTLGLLAAFVYEMGAHGRTIVNRAVMSYPRSPAEFHPTERLMVARKFTVGTAGPLAVWLLALHRSRDDMGDGFATIAILALFFTYVVFFMRIALIEYHAFWTYGVRERLWFDQWYEPYAWLWCFFLVVATAVVAITTFMGAGLTVYPYIEMAADVSASATIALCLVAFVTVVVVVLLFADAVVMSFLRSWRDTLKHANAKR